MVLCFYNFNHVMEGKKNLQCSITPIFSIVLKSEMFK